MLTFLIATAHAGMLYDQLQNAPNVVWAGADYSRARFFVPESFDDETQITFFDPGGGLDDAVRRYGKPQDAWNDLVKEWNTMLLNGVVKNLEKAIQRDVTIDLPTEAGQTANKKAPYWESEYEAKNNPPDMDQKVVADMVKRYRLKTKDGVGIVFIMERGSRLDEQGCVWPTWFDVKKKEVISTARVCEKPGGVGFRNFWLRPIIDMANDIVKGLKKKEL